MTAPHLRGQLRHDLVHEILGDVVRDTGGGMVHGVVSLGVVGLWPEKMTPRFKLVHEIGQNKQSLEAVVIEF